MLADPFDLDLPSWDLQVESAGDLPTWNPAGVECAPGAADQRARLEAFYAEHNPSKLALVDANLRKYKGREAEMWRALHRKYGVESPNGGSNVTAFTGFQAMADDIVVPAQAVLADSSMPWGTACKAEAPTIQMTSARVTISSALLELFHATGGDFHWQRTMGWMQAATVAMSDDNSISVAPGFASWEGINVEEAGEADALVGIGASCSCVSVRLSRNGLEGSLPVSARDAWTPLRHVLTTLDLSHNQLRGTIPPALGECDALTHLNLSGNTLTGTVPERLCTGLPRLRSLLLHRNRLRGPLPGSNVLQLWSRSLTTLDMSHNALGRGAAGADEPLPAALGGLSRLQELWLSNNDIPGEIPPSLGCLTLLRRLVLSNNRLHGCVPPELGCCFDLREIYVDGNDALQGPWPRSLLPTALQSVPIPSVSNTKSGSFIGAQRLQVLSMPGPRTSYGCAAGSGPPCLDLNASAKQEALRHAAEMAFQFDEGEAHNGGCQAATDRKHMSPAITGRDTAYRCHARRFLRSQVDDGELSESGLDAQLNLPFVRTTGLTVIFSL